MAFPQDFGKYEVSREKIADFLCQQTPHPQQSRLWLSLVMPIQNTEDLFRTHAKSVIQQTLRENSQVMLNPNAAQTIREYLEIEAVAWREAQIASSRKDQAWLVYFSFDPAELHHMSASSIREKTHLVTTTFSVEMDESWGDIGPLYNLLPLFWARQKEVKGFTVVLSEKESTILWVENTGASELETLENKYGTEPHNRYMEKVSVTQGQSVRHGTGSEKIDRQQKSGNNLYIQEVFTAVSRHLEEKEENVEITVYSPPGMMELVEKHVEELVRPHTTQSVVIESKVISDHQKSTRDWSEEVIAERMSAQKKFLQQSKKSKGFLHDTKEVVDALRNHQVSHVFVGNEFSTPGYVTPTGLIYTYPARNTKRVEDLLPWIVRTAHLSSAELISGTEVSELFPQPLSALLRYIAE